MYFFVMLTKEISQVPLINYLAHPVDIWPDEKRIDVHVDRSMVPRAAESRRQCGEVAVGGSILPIFEVEYGGLMHVPNIPEGTFGVVSTMTILAARRSGYHELASRMLYPYDVRPDPTTGKLRARGLGLPEPVRAVSTVATIRDIDLSRLENTAGYDCRLFDPRAADFGVSASESVLCLDEPVNAAYIVRDAELNIGLTERLGLQVFRTRFKEVVFPPSQDGVSFANFDVCPITEGPSVAYADIVRDEQGQMIGGRGLTWIIPGHEEYVI